MHWGKPLPGIVWVYWVLPQRRGLGLVASRGPFQPPHFCDLNVPDPGGGGGEGGALMGSPIPKSDGGGVWVEISNWPLTSIISMCLWGFFCTD